MSVRWEQDIAADDGVLDGVLMFGLSNMNQSLNLSVADENDADAEGWLWRELKSVHCLYLNLGPNVISCRTIVPPEMNGDLALVSDHGRWPFDIQIYSGRGVVIEKDNNVNLVCGWHPYQCHTMGSRAHFNLSGWELYESPA